MNRQIIDKLQGNQHMFYSSDSIISEDPNDVINYLPEFLYKQTPSGMPPHVLELKEGVIVMLLWNLNPKKGLCSGTHLTITGFRENMIAPLILLEFNIGDTVLLPRIDLAPSDLHLPFVLKCRQFLIIPAYAMTINKSLGQYLSE
ncbi:hypothetical protein AVEN_65877-1 [Araneus ventricosus]|uniref:DNA helicase Pif1-like 2B domain-containing protein n=1 Tax=Araneus ventricosus TaxID=182803 RepID=A0A4Y2HE95_ARAVE|nr:hypothetical protein AVEN_65877-1 [Araneus ventricosus]